MQYNTSSWTLTSTVNYPEVYITKDHNRYKQYPNDQIFLPPNSNFEIEVYNPSTMSIGMELHYEGKLMSNTMIVIKPGQRIFLDRFIDTNNKFLFETYEIENNSRNIAIAENNGNLKIVFYKESAVPKIAHITDNWTYTPPYIYNNRVMCNYVNHAGTTIPDCSNSNFVSEYPNALLSQTINATLSKMETGRIEKGDKSDQKFTNINIEFESYPFYTSVFKLKPISTQIDFGKIKQYCPECGLRIRNTSWKFCSNCGKKL